MIEPRNVTYQRADMVIHMESNIMQSVNWRVLCGTAGSKSQSCLTLWLISQLGRAYHFLETSTLHQLEDGDGRTSGRQSDSFIVPRKLGNASGGKGAT